MKIVLQSNNNKILFTNRNRYNELDVICILMTHTKFNILYAWSKRNMKDITVEYSVYYYLLEVYCFIGLNLKFFLYELCFPFWLVENQFNQFECDFIERLKLNIWMRNTPSFTTEPNVKFTVFWAENHFTRAKLRAFNL